jgi:alpha-L-arabinofuranosidase
VAFKFPHQQSYHLGVVDTAAALSSWSAINGASIAVVNNTASLSTALPNSLQLLVPEGKTGAVGVQNSGFFGIVNRSTGTSF